MPVLDQFGRPYAAEKLAHKPVRVASAKHRYDAAQTTTDNVRHWAHSDGRSPNAASNSEVRRILRNRARYEAIENNSYAKGIISTLANDTIGTGPRLQIQTGGPQVVDTTIEKLFAMWAKAARLAQKLRTLRFSKAVDGESFAMFVTNERLRHPITLDLRLIEAEQVTTPTYSGLEPLHVDGIELDANGEPEVYHVLRQHPGNDTGLGNALEFDSVPASQMVHLYNEDRPGQARGITEIAPALPLFAQLRAYTLSVIAAADTAAEQAMVIYTDSPAMEPTPESNLAAGDVVELERRAAVVLPSQWKLGQVAAEHPTTTYKMFKAEIINEMARCLNMPFNVAAANSAGYNFASGRLDHQTYHKAINVERSYFELTALDHVLAAWFDELVLNPQLAELLDGLPPMSTWLHQWFWDEFEHVDPAKEANAQSTRLTSFTTTYPLEFARRGLDYETEWRKQAKALGITYEEFQQIVTRNLISGPVMSPQGAEDGDESQETAETPAAA